jgi:predicted nucleic acid-binding protein
METVILDTGILFASAYAKDANHELVRSTLLSIRASPIIVAPALVELFYLSASRVGYPQAAVIFERLQGQYQIEALRAEDILRMAEIMRQYSSSRFDYTDTANMAIAERLGISTIYTFDSDYYRFRPRHTEYFTILP